MRSSAPELHQEAAAEYDAAFDWYLSRSPDAARKFDAEVERALAQIVQAPGRWAAGPHNTRKFLLRRFPFVLIYREISAGSIQVVAVAHTSRKPGYWKQRV
jgi:plasmid stabilization system protein ParE